MWRLWLISIMYLWSYKSYSSVALPHGEKSLFEINVRRGTGKHRHDVKLVASHNEATGIYSIDNNRFNNMDDMLNYVLYL